MRKLLLEDIIPYTLEPSLIDTISPKWSIVEEEFTIGNQSFTSKRFEYEINWSLDKLFDRENKGCVYFLLDGNEVVYIGQTKSKLRIRNHIKRGLRFDSFRFMPTKNDLHKKIEINLLSNYITKYNRTGISRLFKSAFINKSLEKESKKFISRYNMLIFGQEYSTKDMYVHFNCFSKPSVDKKLANKDLFSRVKKGIYVKQTNKYEFTNQFQH